MSRPPVTIPFFRPHVTGHERDLIGGVLASGYLNDGPLTTRFEAELAERIGVRNVVCVTSGTAAIFLALRALGIGPEDTVAVPDLTFIATASAVRMTGADVLLRPVGDDLTMVADHIDVDAAVPVHVSGRRAGMPSGTEVVEDACEAFPTRPRGVAACYSFSPMKILTTGQGGAVATNDDGFAQTVRQLKDHGRSARDSEDYRGVGYNFKFTDLQAAVGLAQLADLALRRQHQRWLMQAYLERLGGVLEFPPFHDEDEPLWRDALATDRDELVAYLLSKGIESRAVWRPLSSCAPYRALTGPSVRSLSERGLWLPSDTWMTQQQVNTVCDEIGAFYENRT